MTSQFAVIHFAEGWRILWDGKKGGRFKAQDTAVSAALRLAGDVRRQGGAVEFLVQDRFGEIQALTLDGEPDAVKLVGSEGDRR